MNMELILATLIWLSMGLCCLIIPYFLLGLTLFTCIAIGCGVGYMLLASGALFIAYERRIKAPVCHELIRVDSSQELLGLNISGRATQLRETCMGTYARFMVWLCIDVLKVKLTVEPEQPVRRIGARDNPMPRRASEGIEFWESIKLTPPPSVADVKAAGENRYGLK